MALGASLLVRRPVKPFSAASACSSMVDAGWHPLRVGSTCRLQAVGLLARDALISVALAVFERDRQTPLDGVRPSATDGKRMLEAYFAAELAGRANEEARRQLRSTLDFANAVQHRQIATFRDGGTMRGSNYDGGECGRDNCGPPRSPTANLTHQS